MNEGERKTGVDDQLASYTARQFVTSDARQLAYDNYESLTFSQSGLAGGTPWMSMLGAETPRGFDYTMTQNGLGGTPSPIANGVLTPLVNQGDFAATFARNVTGSNERLY